MKPKLTATQLKEIRIGVQYLRHGITPKDLKEIINNLTLKQIKEGLRILLEKEIIRYSDKKYYYIRHNYIFSCNVCGTTSIYKSAILSHMENNHVKKYKLGKKIKQCKIEVKVV